MRRGGVTQLVDRVHDRIECRVVADRVVRTTQVAVDRARQTDDGYIELFGEYLGAGERTVTTNHYQCVDACGHHVLVGLLATLGGGELLTTRRFENRTTELDDIAHAARLEIDDLVCYQTFIATHDALHGETVEDSTARHGTNGRIHTGGIAARCEYTDAFDRSHSCVVCLQKLGQRYDFVPKVKNKNR